MIRALIDPSPDAVIAKRLVDRLGRDGARRAVSAVCRKFTAVELAALAARWEMWARPKQLPPPNWLSWGNLTARGWGKTSTCANIITREIMTGRVSVLIMAAQNKTKTESVQVAGLIEAAPPWFRPEYEVSRERLVWPNGARAYAFTPEVPEAIRSPNAQLAWLSELQSWPAATCEEAYSNFVFATRVGGSRLIWDATPKKRHRILKKLLHRAETMPDRHFVVRGSIYENPHIDKVAIETMELDYGGTQKGREELLGEMLEDSDAALVKQAWIDNARRRMPDVLVRRVIGVDPAITNRAGNDSTGIVEDGLGVDGQVYVLGDHSGKYDPAAWALLVLDLYVRNRCDCIVVETNKGGHLVTQNLRAAAGARNLHIVVVGEQERRSHVAGTAYVKEVHARGPKEDRAQPLATAYERGGISHVLGVDLVALEDVLTTWEPTPGQRSPDALDAHVHAAGELLGLSTNKPNAKIGYQGINELAKAVAVPRSPVVTNPFSQLFGRGGAGRI